jgi:PST family polysaccharide transporter
MSTYKEILRSSVIVGGSQLVIILIGTVRTKIMAILLGPEGIGLTGLYQTAIGVIGNMTALGLGYSGIRMIAEANGAGDLERVARVYAVLKRIPVWLGLIGFGVVVILRNQLASHTFGDASYGIGVAIVGSMLLFFGLQTPFSGLMQGMRRIDDLAIYNILGTAAGTVLGIAFIYLWHTNGIAPALAVGAASTVVTSWWFTRNIHLPRIKVSLLETWQTTIHLSRVGLALTFTGLVGASAAYLTRWILVHWLGMGAVGLYQATWTLASLYVNVILGAMGTDFYPRLTGVCNDNDKMNTLVKEQVEMGVLMATPGILLILVFAPLILHIFYSSAFLPAAEIIRWQVLGVAARVMFWPLSYVPLAKGDSRLYMFTDGSLNLILLLTLGAGVRLWGLRGAGIAFLIGNIIHGALLWAVCRRVTKLDFNHQTLRPLILCLVSSVAVFLAVTFLGTAVGPLLGSVVLCSVSFICVMKISRLLGGNLLAQTLRLLRLA